MKQKVGTFEHLTTKLVCKTVFAKVLAKISGIHKIYIYRKNAKTNLSSKTERNKFERSSLTCAKNYSPFFI